MSALDEPTRRLQYLRGLYKSGLMTPSAYRTAQAEVEREILRICSGPGAAAGDADAHVQPGPGRSRAAGGGGGEGGSARAEVGGSDGVAARPTAVTAGAPSKKRKARQLTLTAIFPAAAAAAAQQLKLKTTSGRATSAGPGAQMAPARLELRWPCPVPGCTALFKTKGARVNHCSMIKDPVHVAAVAEMCNAIVQHNKKQWESRKLKGVFSDTQPPARLVRPPAKLAATEIAAKQVDSRKRPRNRGADRRKKLLQAIQVPCAAHTVSVSHELRRRAVEVGVAVTNLRRWYKSRTSPRSLVAVFHNN